MRTSMLILLVAESVLANLIPPAIATPDANCSHVRSAVGANRNPYFGELHLHTSYSLDAYLAFGAQVDPESAYLFARGKPGYFLGEKIERLSPPLDFMAVTDHAEYFGILNSIDKRRIPQDLRAGDLTAWEKIVTGTNPNPFPGVDTAQLTQTTWRREIDAANRNYVPGKFTTFIGYEWTSMPNDWNLHRNIIFSGDNAPNPFTAIDSRRPEDLWAYLAKARERGYDALAIPHNSNLSGGLMFDGRDSEGRLIDREYAAARARNEPLVEIVQNKGQSETRPELSPSDEFANFEALTDVSETTDAQRGSYVRPALGRGLEMQESLGGINPYKYGFVGGSDFHNGLSDSSEQAYAGLFGSSGTANINLPDLEQWAPRLGAKTAEERESEVSSMLENGSAGLTGVWAEQNTRESIFAALRRKETFATSGTRIEVRFFGGWQFGKDILAKKDWVRRAYLVGVPMGGDLPAKPKEPAAPGFILWALKDPNGANLDRLQVVKLWVSGGKYVEKVYDVALSGGRGFDPNGGRPRAIENTVNVKEATYTNTVGATELRARWLDPQFDAAVPAAYYLRVIEIPTPRWSTINATRRGRGLPRGVPGYHPGACMVVTHMVYTAEFAQLMRVAIPLCRRKQVLILRPY